MKKLTVTGYILDKTISSGDKKKKAKEIVEQLFTSQQKLPFTD